MATVGSRERRLWIAVALAVAAIFASLYPLQFLLDFLRSRNLLRLSIALLFLGCASGVAAWMIRRRARPRQWLLLGVAALLYAAFALALDVPQERLHLVEYGALALLLRAAFAERRRAAGQPADERSAALRALAAATAIGFVDELIQGVLPNRQYDLRDVVFNALSAAMALGTFAAIRCASPADPA